MPGPKPLLERGVCNHGHPIRSEADLYYMWSRGRSNPRCKECSVIAKERCLDNQRGHSRQEWDVKRAMILSCGQELIFERPMPRVGEDLWCSLHREYEKVVRWGTFTTTKRKVAADGRPD